MKRAALFLLAACRSSVFVAESDAESSPIVDALVADAEADGTAIVVRGSPGVRVVVDSAWLSDYNVKKYRECSSDRGKCPGGPDGELCEACTVCAVGYYEPALLLVRIASTTEWVKCNAVQEQQLSAKGQKLTLAHELGHAGGLGHAAHGIMATTTEQYACRGREAACLAEALGLR